MNNKLTNQEIAKVFAMYFPEVECITPDGIGKITGLPTSIKCYDRVNVHFGRMVKTANSIDGGYDKTRNHGYYAFNPVRYEPWGSQGRTEDGFDIPGGVQLLLTPLSAISDEDAIQVARLAFQMQSGFKISKRDKYGIHLMRTSDNGIWYHCYLKFSGEIVTHLQFEADEEEPFQSFNHNIGRVFISSSKPIPYASIVDFYRSKGYDFPVYFGIDHWANGKTPIQLGIAVDKTKINNNE